MSRASTALLTDHYELTMLDAARRSGVAGHRAVFEVFARSLPDRRRYGVVAGVGRLVEMIERFRFTDEELHYLADAHVVSPDTCAWLADYRFTGTVDAYAEGEAYFPGSPVLAVESSFGEAVLLETLILSVLNHDTAVASAAARMVCAAGDRPLLEMGSRRTHEEAAVASARAAYLAGFSGTSNLEAGRRFGIPTVGTSAHAFTLAHGDEKAAFAAQVETLGPGTTLLVDTYDTRRGVERAVAAAGPDLGAVRLDSGDLLSLAHETRQQLDALGATKTRIVVTSDLDEHAIAALASAPVDSYGVGTSVVTGSGSPTAGFVYKLVARAVSSSPGAPLEPVAKRSLGKSTTGGRKWPARRVVEGVAVAEIAHLSQHAPSFGADERPLFVRVMRDGEPAEVASLAQAREHARAARAELPPAALKLSPGEPALVCEYEEATE